MVFFVIPMMNGLIGDVSGHELYEDAEAQAIKIAKEYGVEATSYEEVEELLNRETDGRDVYIEHGPYFEAQEGDTFKKYNYEYDGQYMFDEELVSELRKNGHEPDEENLYRWVREKQNGDRGDSIDGLRYKATLTYRQGERWETTFASDDADAVDLVVGENEHWDMWEVDDEA